MPSLANKGSMALWIEQSSSIHSLESSCGFIMHSMPKLLYLCLAIAGAATHAYAQEKAAKAPLPTRELGAFASAYDLLQSSLAKPTDPKALMLAALRAMVLEADPDGGDYLTEEAVAELRGGSKPGFGSAGMEVQRRGLAYVVAPYSGGAARAAGVFQGDELRKIDGKDLGDLSYTAITAALRGPVGSSVALTLFRPSTGRSIDLTVVRAQREIPPPTLTRHLQEYVVLRLHTFRSPTPTQVAELLSKAWEERIFKGIVLDLRGNPGGLLEPSLAVCSMFLPKGALIATSKGRTPAANQEFKATDVSIAPPAAREVPIVVLVDEGTASAAEIVAAALQDNKRARLVGRSTFGRGSIQTIQPISGGGALKYTTGYWESPSGRAIHNNPLVPDRTVAVADADVELQTALEELTRSK